MCIRDRGGLLDSLNVYSNCSVVLLYYFRLNDLILLCDCLDIFEHALAETWTEVWGDEVGALAPKIFCRPPKM